MAKAKTSKKINSKKTVKAVKAPNKKLPKKQGNNQTLYSQLKLNESYVSLILGAVVVLGVFVLFFIFINESNQNKQSSPAALDKSITPVLSPAKSRTYIILQDETLWDVAVKYYGDGFRYVDIIEANSFENPDYIPPGTKIIIPNAN